MWQDWIKCKDIAEILKMPWSTMSTMLSKWIASGCLETKKPGQQPLILFAHVQQDLGQLINHDCQQTLYHVCRQFSNPLEYYTKVCP